jgi:hypothetical protein
MKPSLEKQSCQVRNRTMRRITLIFAAALTLVTTVAARPASAVIGVTDRVPAATLLLPYFEVDLDNPNANTTLFSVNNASATAVLAHITLWSDLGVPTLAFNMYLTGYDVQTVNLRDIFAGKLPRTASAGQDPTDTISNKGNFSQDINFASCTGQFPLPMLPADYLDHLRKAHTGEASPFFLNRCSGVNRGDNIARGYVTVDTVNNCTLRVAGDPGYFLAGGTGDATNQNVLWGDYFFVDNANNFAQGDGLVHIEASASSAQTAVAGEYTFYGRYVSWAASDNREPLAAISMARFLNGGAFTGGTNLLVWRDSKVDQDAFNCPTQAYTRPAWFPLSAEDVVVFDEQETAELAGASSSLGLATQKVQVDGALFPVTPTFGMVYLNLNQINVASIGNPPEDPQAAQSFVATVMSASGRFSVGQAATVIEHAGEVSQHVCLSGMGTPLNCMSPP